MMSNDISPLSAVSSTPLVREKRHYSGENASKKKKSDDQSKKKKKQQEIETLPEDKTIEGEQSKNSIDKEIENVKVSHIDEYV